MWSKKHDSSTQNISKKIWFLIAYFNPHKDARRYSQNHLIFLSSTSSLIYPAAPALLFCLSILEEFLSNLSLHTHILTHYIMFVHDHWNTKSKRAPWQKNVIHRRWRWKELQQRKRLLFSWLGKKTLGVLISFHPTVAFFSLGSQDIWWLGLLWVLMLILSVLPPHTRFSS